MKSNIKIQTTLRLNKNLYQKTAEEAGKIGLSVNSYITMILSKELQKNSKNSILS